MNIIMEFDLSENTLRGMLELNPYLKEISDEEVNEKIIILEKINCFKTQIRNIISSNSLFLNRTNEEIITLINKLLEFGFNNLNILFDSNPYILNLESFEIENYVNDKIKEGKKLEDIIDELNDNPLLFNEM